MPFFRHQPQWLYDALPALYLFGGAAVVVAERSALGLASGGLLIVCSVLVVAQRRRNSERRRMRDAPTSRMGRSSIMAPPSRLASTTELVRAVMPPKLGHAHIDRQHRSLASRSATLRVAFAHNDDAADIELLIHELVDTLSHHVTEEIAAMRRLGVARSSADVHADRERLRDAESAMTDYRMGGLTLEALIERVAGNAVAGHLGSLHPPLPSMEMALHLLREAKD